MLSRLTGLTSLNLSQNPRLGDAGVRHLAGHMRELQVSPAACVPACLACTVLLRARPSLAVSGCCCRPARVCARG